MKLKVLLAALFAIAFVGCNNQQPKTAQTEASEFVAVTSIQLAENIAEYQDAKVEMEGMVSHVCRSGGKMMVVADNGTVITIYPKDTTEKYDADLARKIVKVYGVAADKLAEGQQACGSHEEHEEHEEHGEGCEHEKQAAEKPVVIITCDKYEVIGDADAE